MRQLPNSQRLNADHIANLASARQILRNTDKAAEIDSETRDGALDLQAEVYGLVQEGGLHGELEFGLMSLVKKSPKEDMKSQASSPMHAWAPPSVGCGFVVDDNMADVLSQENTSLRKQIRQSCYRTELDLDGGIFSSSTPAIAPAHQTSNGLNLYMAISPMQHDGTGYSSDESEEDDSDEEDDTLLTRRAIKERSTMCVLLCSDATDEDGPASMRIEPLDALDVLDAHREYGGDECPCA
jgi:hypothetical protein